MDANVKMLCVLIIGEFLVALPFIIRLIREKRQKKETWLTAVAVTTGRTNIISKFPKRGPDIQYTEYEIKYQVNGVTYRKFFDLYPGPDIGDVLGDDTEVKIKYLMSNPKVFEVEEVLY